MKRDTLLYCLVFISSWTFAQDVSSSLLANSGTTNSDNSIQLNWTLGEISISNYSKNEFKLSEGFLASIYRNGTVTNQNIGDLKWFDIYPNPTKDRIYLSMGVLKEEVLEIQIINNKGKVILRQSDFTPIIDLSHLPSDIYYVLLKMKSRENHISRLIKI